MQGGVGLLGGGSGSNENESGESKVVESDDELELELGLSLGGGGGGGGGKGKGVSTWSECGRILTAKDFPSAVKRAFASSSPVAVAASVSGTKRAADSVPHEAGSSPPGANQVVGWPPIRAYRMNSLVSQAKTPRSEEEQEANEKEKSKEASKKKICNGKKTNNAFNEKGHLGFVKVNMDGVPIGRKVDLNAHASYETLAQTLEEMFFTSTAATNSICGEKDPAAKPSKLLDGSSEFVLTYEDKDGDWMLVGDVPWRMFVSSVKRLRIMRTSEANGLAPRFQTYE